MTRALTTNLTLRSNIESDMYSTADPGESTPHPRPSRTLPSPAATIEQVRQLIRSTATHVACAQELLTVCWLQGFDAEPHLRLVREMLRQLFATPVKHHKSKPFVDHVISFYVADGRIWLRNYQASRVGHRVAHLVSPKVWKSSCAALRRPIE